MSATGTKRPRPGRQRDILRAFTEHVAERGYDLTSLADIAEELHLSKGTIMHHFQSKDRMLQIMSHEYMSRRLAEVTQLFEVYPEPRDRLAGVIIGMITAHRDDRAATIAFSRELMRFAGNPVMADVRDLRRGFVTMLTDLLQSGMERGAFIRSDAPTIALQVIGMCNWCWTWLDPNGRLSIDEVASIFVRTVMGGLVQGKGQLRFEDILDTVRSIREAA